MPNNPAPKVLKSTTQDHLDIEDIIQDLIILKDGSVCLILEISAINFGLFSEKRTRRHHLCLRPTF